MDLRIHSRERHARIFSGKKGKQTGAPCQRHIDRHLRRLPRAERKPSGPAWPRFHRCTQGPGRRQMNRAAWMKDQGMQTTAQSSMAKLYAGEVAVRVANECVQVHGGYGFIKEYPAEKFYRDVKLCTIGEGTSEIQRLVIAREILRD